jgi:23S rRNA (guanosine2251-2'-O)-methyltransferase
VLETIRAGRRVVYEVLTSHESGRVSRLLETVSAVGVRISVMSPHDLDALVGPHVHQGLAARVGPFPYVDVDDVIDACRAKNAVAVILDGVQDPVNVGAVLRSVDCLGGGGLVIPKDRAAGITPVAEKAAAGASAHTPVALAVNISKALAAFKEAGFWVYAAEASAPASAYSTAFHPLAALVLGSEGAGIRRLVRDSCDFAVSIPLTGSISSLNVAQASVALLSEALRQKIQRDSDQTRGRPGARRHGASS